MFFGLTKRILRADLVVDCALHVGRVDTLGGGDNKRNTEIFTIRWCGGDIGQV